MENKSLLPKKIEWKALPGAENMVLDGDGFYISYNPSPCSLISMFRSDTGGAETALCVTEREYYILNGDFRKEYEEAFPDLQECQEVYEKLKGEYRSSWSGDSNE